jgi:hypothetical protein
MLCTNTNVLFHNISFDPRSSPIGNMALTIGISLSIEKQGLFFKLLHIQSQKGILKKNPTTK